MKQQLRKFDKEEVVVQIIGATSNRTVKPLEKLFVQFEKTEPELAFACAVAILSIKTKPKQQDDDEEDDFFGDKYNFGVISTNIGRLEMLLSRGLQNRPIPFSASKYPEAHKFWDEFFTDVTGLLFSGIVEIAKGSGYFGNSSEEAFIQLGTFRKILGLISEYQLGDVDTFFKKLSDKLHKAIDESYEAAFTNSISKIWDARRAALNYFLDQLIFCNLQIPSRYLKALEKRRKAWFLLESKYKEERKKVVRGTLRAEVKQVIQMLAAR